MLAQSILLFFSALLLVAAWSDATRYTIPNTIPAVLVMLWPVAAWVFGVGWAGVITSLIVGVAVLGLAMILWMPGWIGGGDGKLIAAIALWFAWPDVTNFLLYTLLAGGVLSVGLVLIRKLAPTIGMAGKAFQGTALEAGGSAPYGIAIAAGALLTLPQSHLLVSAGG